VLTSSATIAIIGFGETGSAYGRALVQRGLAVQAFDEQLHNSASANWMQERMAFAGAAPKESLVAAVRGAKLVILALPAACTSTQRQAITQKLERGQHLLCARTDSAALLQFLGFSSLPPPLPTDLPQPAMRGELP
jgi:prephenate dehydrogenase